MANPTLEIHSVTRELVEVRNIIHRFIEGIKDDESVSTTSLEVALMKLNAITLKDLNS